MSNLYQQIALELARNIDAGIYVPGEKVPGIRALKERMQVSASTAVAAYRQLELDGYIESRPRSGFYVSKRANTRFEEPAVLEDLPRRPKLVAQQARVLSLSNQINNPKVVKLGAAVPDACYLPVQLVRKTTNEVLKRQSSAACIYEEPLGALELRQQLSKRMAQLGCLCRPEEIIVTSGCQEAVFLALKSITKPGDVVALESPSYHGHVQIVEALGLKAVEIPADPRKGISLEALQLATDQWSIKACLLIPNFSNPLGAKMSEANKKALIKLANTTDMVLIEDDIYGDLDFSHNRPRPLKAFDTHEKVIYCSSFSKTIAPGMRVGWLVSANYLEAVEYQKIITNVSVSPLPQMVISDILQTGRYEKHLRYIRVELEKSMSRIRAAVARYFPRETRMTLPGGGYVLWLELPSGVDALRISEQALAKGISVAPGPIFSSSGKYTNYIRLSFAVKWRPEIDLALGKLGALVKAECR